MSEEDNSVLQILKREGIVFLGLLAFGVLVLPALVYLVGQFVFGAYEGDGYGQFFSSVLDRLFAFDGYAWFLALSPFLCVTILRLMTRGWKLAGASGNN